jgi:uncharacterized protein
MLLLSKKCYTTVMETLKNNWKWVVGGGIVVIALVIFFAARDFSKNASYVEVKGLSEQIVKADTAVWSMSFEVKSNNVDSLYADIEKNITAIKTFLKQKGFEEGEINVAPVNIYQDTFRDAAFRYNAANYISVYTQKVDLAKTVSGDTLLLVKQGIVLNQNYIAFNVSDINSIKPQMLEEAIQNAKETAEQFAQNAGSRLGRVTRGNQGVFDITDKDPGSPEYKKIRLVSTLRFLIR